MNEAIAIGLTFAGGLIAGAALVAGAMTWAASKDMMTVRIDALVGLLERREHRYLQARQAAAAKDLATMTVKMTAEDRASAQFAEIKQSAATLEDYINSRPLPTEDQAGALEEYVQGALVDRRGSRVPGRYAVALAFFRSDDRRPTSLGVDPTIPMSTPRPTSTVPRPRTP